MNRDLYNPSYLEQTAHVLEQFKKNSYEAFHAIKEGTVAEVGCGIGFDAKNLAKILGHTVKVVGLDMDSNMIEEAKLGLSDADNLRFQVAEAEHLPFEKESVSGLRSERLMQHVKSSGAVLAECHRVLKTGAPLVIAETDWASFSIYNGSLDIRRKLKAFLVEEHVNNGDAAVRLMGDLESAGFKGMKMQVFPFTSNSLSYTFSMLKIDEALLQMKEKGRISADAYNLFTEELKTTDDHGAFVCSINLIIVTARK